MAVLSILLRSICLLPHSTAITSDESSPVLSPDGSEGLQNGKELDQEPNHPLPHKQRKKIYTWFHLPNKQPEDEAQSIQSSEARERKAKAKRAAKETRKAESGRKAETKCVAKERRRARGGGKSEEDGWEDSQLQQLGYYQFGMLGYPLHEPWWAMGQYPVYPAGVGTGDEVFCDMREEESCEG